ncbi:MAG TPA: glycosyltransferase [Aquihabitans sp.]|nr:glycosyltransferase [Aquihabitans sp.]
MPEVVLDARWIAKGGTGTFTASLLEGLAHHRPDGWAVWGPPAVRDRLWPGAAFVPGDADPAGAFGQRDAFRVPPGRLVLHPHQTRPAHRYPAASCVLDLIQLEHPSPAVRVAMAARLRRTVRAARILFTISEEVRHQLVDAYRVDPADVTVLHLPVDDAAARRIAARRAAGPPRGRYLVAVGRFAPHKNHRRLVEAFVASRFAATGGELHLVGGNAAELVALGVRRTAGVVVRGVLDAGQLEAELAGALGLVQPSLREGHGLPVTEALLAGVPVTSSPVPAAVESGPPALPVFDPHRTGEIARAIDELVDLVEGDRYWQRVDRTTWADGLPTSASLVGQVLDRLDRSGHPQQLTGASPDPHRAGLAPIGGEPPTP